MVDSKPKQEAWLASCLRPEVDMEVCGIYSSEKNPLRSRSLDPNHKP